MTNDNNNQPLNMPIMVCLSLLVGVIAGFGSIVFRAMIGLVHNLFFLGKFQFYYDANVHTPLGPWGVGIILAPVIGSVVVTWLTQTFAPEARGHGVPEVMNAIHYQEGKIRPIVAVVKSIASAISIGSGGSVGREGPIIQIGSAFGSTIGQIIKMPTRQRIVLIAAGAGAAIASTFNAPIGGLAFAIELMLVSISASSIALVAIATVTATHIGRIYLGLTPSFNIPDLMAPLTHVIPAWEMLCFVPFGIVCGVACVLFIHSIYWAEDKFDDLIANPYVRHAFGMFFLGVMIYAFGRFTGHYHIEGVGYASIAEILKDLLSHPGFLLLLFFCKLLATSFTLGSGASGGVFSPSLFLGASLGSFTGNLLHYFFPGLGIDPTFFAVAGMAAMVSGSTGAVITAITMTFEMTRNYASILPIMTSVAIAYAVRIKLCRESIYTLKLQRRGYGIPQGLQTQLTHTKKAKDIMETRFDLLTKNEIANWRPADDMEFSYCLVTEDNKILGVLHESAPKFSDKIEPTVFLRKQFNFVTPTTEWDDVIKQIHDPSIDFLIVSNKQDRQTPTDILGIISTREIAQTARNMLDLM